MYFIRLRGGLTKIGTTKRFTDRMSQLLSPDPEQAFICAYYIRHDAHLVERLWHKTFADKRVQGEWFQLSDADIDKVLSFTRRSGPEYEPVSAGEESQ